MKIGEAEARVVENWSRSEQLFARSTEQLVQSLLWEFKIDQDRCTDGLLPETEQKTATAYSGTAILVLLPDQSVEPVSLDIAFDSSQGKLTSAQIRFGWPGWNGAIFGSSRHSKMSGILAARLEQNWLWTFTRSRDDWTVEANSAKRDPLLWPSP